MLRRTLVALGVVAACADPPATTSEGSTEETTTSGTGSSTGAGSTAASPTTGAPMLVPYARGLRLTRVTATQGVQVELVRDGVEVPADEHPVKLIAGRTTVLRADWLLHAEFTPRALLGRLTLWTAEDEEKVLEFKAEVEGPSSEASLLTTFSWQLGPELVRPGLRYRIEALEPDVALATGEVSDPPPVLPLAGPGTLTVADVRMELKVTLVPIRHVFMGMTCEPTITQADVDAMAAALTQHNPVERAVMTMHAPMEYTESIGTSQEGFVPILTALGLLRAKEKPADNEYYYGLITSCDGYPGSLYGQAYGIPDEPTPTFAFQRIATGRYLDSGAAAAETFVHEIGHTQGRYHVLCSGGEAGVDTNYPYPNGRIGVWGYGILDTQTRSPATYRDYMTYCAKTWVSDYGWRLTYDTIRELTSWDQAGAPRLAGGKIVAASLSPEGRARALVTRGDVPRRDGDALVEFVLPGGEVVRAPASRRALPDGAGDLLVAALPADAAGFSALSLRVGGEVRATLPATAVSVGAE